MQIQITNMDYNTSNGGVVSVHWIASDEQDGFSAVLSDIDNFQPDAEASGFIPYEALTESDVVQWLLDKEGWEEKISTSLSLAIARQKYPPVLSGLPWAE